MNGPDHHFWEISPARPRTLFVTIYFTPWYSAAMPLLVSCLYRLLGYLLLPSFGPGTRPTTLYAMTNPVRVF
jgi:hypothetical protein